jgi:predicted AlkP superfamily phosphohydrolase/phosphomutase/Flp pilus assembly protein TadD
LSNAPHFPIIHFMKLRLLVVIVIALALLGAVAGMRHVGPDEQAVRTGRDGSAAAVASGWHFVGPGSQLVKYPVGDWSARSPQAGTTTVTFSNGDTVGVAFESALVVPPHIADLLYREFSKDFAPAFQKLVASAAEIEAAALDDPSRAGDLESTVQTRVAQEMGRFQVQVKSVALVQLGSEQRKSHNAGSGAARRLIIVGVDGGDWMNLRPLIDTGKLPNFAKLVHDGASGPLRSEEPMLSPLLWTTMATGRLPEQHGVLNFTAVDKKTGARTPVSRHDRKVDAFWNMLGDYKHTVDVIGWLATDPAETINGVMVTDKFGYLAYVPEDTKNTAQSENGSVFPATRRSEFEALVTHAGAVKDEDLSRFVHLSPDELAKHRHTTDPNDPVNNLLHLYASTRTYQSIATHLLDKDRPDVLAVYFEWVDAVSHLFMLHTPPRLPDVPEAEFERYQDAVEQAYVVQDEVLGEIMQHVDERTVLMVISDHGFKSGAARLKNRPEIWAGNAALWHRPEGIVAFYGAGVKKGAGIEGASIRDVAPTVLALMGLPRADDMAGLAITSAFEEDVARSFSTEHVPTLDKKRGDATANTTSGASEETMKKLEALGYLTPDNPDALHNLGQRYQQKGEYQKAIESYKKAIAMRPTFYNAYNNLATCYGELKMYPQAVDALEKCIKLKPDDYYAMSNLAVIMMNTGKPGEALRFAKQAVDTEPAYVNGHVTYGAMLAMAKRLDEAEKEFNEALRLDPNNANARENLKRVQAAKNQ